MVKVNPSSSNNDSDETDTQDVAPITSSLNPSPSNNEMFSDLTSDNQPSKTYTFLYTSTSLTPSLSSLSPAGFTVLFNRKSNISIDTSQLPGKLIVISAPNNFNSTRFLLYTCCLGWLLAALNLVGGFNE